VQISGVKSILSIYEVCANNFFGGSTEGLRLLSILFLAATEHWPQSLREGRDEYFQIINLFLYRGFASATDGLFSFNGHLVVPYRHDVWLESFIDILQLVQTE
jgi:hypothetical protein